MGNTYYQSDKAIDRWAHMRENTHLTFRMSPRTVGYGLLFGVAIPALIYYGIVTEFSAKEKAKGLSEKKMWLK